MPIFKNTNIENKIKTKKSKKLKLGESILNINNIMDTNLHRVKAALTILRSSNQCAL